MPLPTVISDISPVVGTGAAPNAGQPGGGENPSTFDDYLRLYSAFIAQLRAGGGLAASGANRVPFFDGAGALTSAADFVRDAGGNVGIGTATFSYAAANRGLIQVNGASTAFYGMSVGGVGVGYLAAASTNIELAAVGFTSFVNNGTERLRLDANGHQINTPGNTTPPTLTANGQFNITPTSNTNIRISYRGTDGVTRVANITLA